MALRPHTLRTYDHRTVDSAGAFLQGELEKLDPTINLPLAEVTWQRDMDLREDVVMTDDSASFVHAGFAAGGMSGSGKSLIGKTTTAVQGINLDLNKTVLNLYLWAMELGWSVIELEQSQRLNRPIDRSKYDGMVLKHQMDCDEMVYIGDTGLQVPGLINNPAIPAQPLLTSWSGASPDDILTGLNLFLEEAWKRSAYVVAPTDLLLPANQFAALTRPVTAAGSESIMSYVTKNCVAALKNGKPLNIRPLKWLSDAGDNGLGRAVAYTRDKKYVRFPLVPMQKTPLEYRGLNHLTTYYAKMGQVEFVYPETVYYGDWTAPADPAPEPTPPAGG